MCEFFSKAQPKMYKAINLSFLMNSSGSSMFVEAFQMILAIKKSVWMTGKYMTLLQEWSDSLLFSHVAF